MIDLYAQVNKLTKAIKTNFSYVYFSYATAFWSFMLLPRSLPGPMIDTMTKKYTCAFSNAPGPIKPLKYIDANGQYGFGTHGIAYFRSPFHTCLTIACISWADTLQVSTVCDDPVLSA